MANTLRHKNWFLKHAIALTLLITLLTGCSKDFGTEWKREDFEVAHFERMAVMGLSHEIESRTFYEQEAIKALNSKGIQAIEGISIFPQEISELDHSYDSLKTRIEKNNIDAVLVIKILHEDDHDFLMPDDYNKFTKLYFRRRSYHTFASGYYSKPDDYYMIATLYDLRTIHEENEETVIWRASEHLLNPALNREKCEIFIQNVVDHLITREVIK